VPDAVGVWLSGVQRCSDQYCRFSRITGQGAQLQLHLVRRLPGADDLADTPMAWLSLLIVLMALWVVQHIFGDDGPRRVWLS
jgi:hypothetical protein